MGTGPHLSLHTAMELVEAVEAGRLFLEYQPVIDLDSGRLEGVEALVRWAHPERGTLAPDAFLPQAQRSRLGGLVTSFVLRAAAEQWMAWHDKGFCISISVNVTPEELLDATVPEEVTRLADTGFDAGALTIEITERRVRHLDRVVPALETLRELGVRLSIDDFGTGDSSLTRLLDLAFDEIKIDRSFVTGCADPGAARSIVRFATDLGHSLGLSVVAEGVEAPEDLDSLRSLDVDLVQGYYLGRPASAESIEHLLAGA